MRIKGLLTLMEICHLWTLPQTKACVCVCVYIYIYNLTNASLNTLENADIRDHSRTNNCSLPMSVLSVILSVNNQSDLRVLEVIYIH